MSKLLFILISIALVFSCKQKVEELPLTAATALEHYLSTGEEFVQSTRMFVADSTKIL